MKCEPSVEDTHVVETIVSSISSKQNSLIFSLMNFQNCRIIILNYFPIETIFDVIAKNRWARWPSE